MDLSAYNYSLPDELIARFPAPNRRDSRLLVLPGNAGAYLHERFVNLVQFLRAGDVLVNNDTKVIPARLYGTKDSGGKIE
ncbi:MAG: S-adenosylmethionine:tRNA ribosyltransferase-isomerase, partial [Pseudomonadota bacterium]